MGTSQGSLLWQEDLPALAVGDYSVKRIYPQGANSFLSE